MSPSRSRPNLDKTALRVLEKMEDLIVAMEEAAEQVSSGRALEDISVGSYQLYVAAHEGRRALVCVWEAEDYIDLLSCSAKEAGFSLEELAELDVSPPEAEFGEGMITGGFGAFKGLLVEHRNDPLEDLLEMVRTMLKMRGLGVATTTDEIVIFCLPLRG